MEPMVSYQSTSRALMGSALAKFVRPAIGWNNLRESYNHQAASMRLALRDLAVPSNAHKGGTKVSAILRYRRVPAAVEWLGTAFGFAKHHVVTGEGDSILSAQLTVGDHMIMVLPVDDSDLAQLIKQPDELGSIETQSCYIVVDDAAAHYRKAKTAGATILLDISDDGFGGSGYACRDPEGHIWTFGTHDPWQAQPHAKVRSTWLGRGLAMGAALSTIAIVATIAGWMLPRSPTFSAEAIRLQHETAAAQQHAEQEEKRATLLADELSQERNARDTVERAVRQARELLAQEQSAKRAAETSTRQLEGQLAAARRSNEAAEQKVREAGAQIASERAARQAAERAASETSKEINRERDAKQQAERSTRDAVEQLTREQRAKDEALRATKLAREQLAQTQGEKSDALVKDSWARASRQKKVDDRIWDCEPRPPDGQVTCRPITGK